MKKPSTPRTCDDLWPVKIYRAGEQVGGPEHTPSIPVAPAKRPPAKPAPR